MNMNKIKNELNTAYRHFGDYEDHIINQNVNTWLTRLQNQSEDIKEFVLDTKEVIGGVAIDIACREIDCTSEVINGTEYVKTTNEAVILVVNTDSMRYVVETYEAYEDVAGDDTQFKNYHHKEMALSDIVGKYTTIWP
jgi:hypothetical protein